MLLRRAPRTVEEALQYLFDDVEELRVLLRAERERVVALEERVAALEA